MTALDWIILACNVATLIGVAGIALGLFMLASLGGNRRK